MNKNIRNKLAGYLLKKELGQNRRVPGVISFDQAKSIGILYDATNDHDYELMKNYVKELRGASKDVIALGYFNQKELPSMRFMKLGLDLFTKKSLDWKQKPKGSVVSSFLDKKFDILICFNLDRSVPLSYLASQANAIFKIGRYEKTFAGMFDFMIKPETQPTLKQMMEQVDHYLKLIRNESIKEA